MFEKFLALVERIADALEVIAAAKTGNDAPRVATPETTKAETTKPTDDKAAKAADTKAAKEKKAAEAKAKADEAAKAAAAAAELDPLGGGEEPADEAKEYTAVEVREILAKVIDQDGRNAAFAILKDKGGGAKSFTDLKKEYFEDVYIACKDKLGE